MRTYSTDVKRTMLEKLLRPDGSNVPALSEEMGIPKGTLYTWLNEARNGGMQRKRNGKQSLNLQKKMSLVLEARGLRDEELGRWLREKGLHESQLSAWEKEIESFLNHSEDRGEREKLQQENKELKRELYRKDKALAEMTALVVLKKKLEALLGEEESPV